MEAIFNVSANTNPADESAHSSVNAGTRPVLSIGAAGLSKAKVWGGRCISGVCVLFLLFDSLAKLLMATPVVEATDKLGYPTSTIVPIGATLLICVVIYAIPRLAVVGAVLLTGYLGGAVATHLRVGDPLFSHVLFPIYFAVLIWGGLYLRDRRVRSMILGSTER